MWWQRLKNLHCLASFLQAKHCLLLLPLLLDVDGQHYLVIPDPDIKTVYLRVGGESPAFDLVSEPQQQLEHHGLQDRSTEALHARVWKTAIKEGEESTRHPYLLKKMHNQQTRVDCQPKTNSIPTQTRRAHCHTPFLLLYILQSTPCAAEPPPAQPDDQAVQQAVLHAG